MKLNTRWFDYQPSTEKFENSPEQKPAKTAEINFDVSAGLLLSQNQNFSPLEAQPEAYEEGLGKWLRKRCSFRDGNSSMLGALHRDYAVWCDKVEQEVPASFRIFKWLLEHSGFRVTDDGLVRGLVFTEDLRAVGSMRAFPK